VDLETFLDNFRFLMDEELQSKDAQLEIRLNTPQKNLPVRSDGDFLKQVLLNLVKNALEAGASIINTDFDLKKDKIIITVTDNGSGIDAKIKDSIFKPYISSKTKGMGLGLHITRRLVDALAGEIHLLQWLPGETSFQVTLPLM
jgi:C4-dicarboxylate-specific signal transduction histidine kinase